MAQSNISTKLAFASFLISSVVALFAVLNLGKRRALFVLVLFFSSALVISTSLSVIYYDLFKRLAHNLGIEREETKTEKEIAIQKEVDKRYDEYLAQTFENLNRYF